MRNIVEIVFSFASRIKNGRTLRSIHTHAGKEMKELDVEITAVENGEIEGVDGVVGEAVDVMACMLDIIWSHKPDITVDEINELMTAKCEKWERVYS